MTVQRSFGRVAKGIPYDRLGREIPQHRLLTRGEWKQLEEGKPIGYWSFQGPWIANGAEHRFHSQFFWVLDSTGKTQRAPRPELVLPHD